MQAQLTAHKATVEMLKDQAENEKQASLTLQQDRHNQNLGAKFVFSRFHSTIVYG